MPDLPDHALRLAPSRDAVEATRREAVIVGWVQWLLTFKWDWFVTGTWRGEVSDAAARATARRWLDGLGCPEAYALLAVAKGATDCRTHVHLLVGRVGRSALCLTHARRSWVRAGHLRVEPYNVERGRSGGVRYVVAQASGGDVEVFDTFRRWRPTRRGSRGGRESMTGGES